MLAADIAHHRFDAMVDEIPTAHIARLFLTPDNFSIGSFRQHPLKRPVRERINLFQTDDADVIDASLVARRQQIVIDFAGTNHDAIGFLSDLWIMLFDDTMEGAAARQIVKARDALLMPQQ